MPPHKTKQTLRDIVESGSVRSEDPSQADLPSPVAEAGGSPSGQTVSVRTYKRYPRIPASPLKRVYAWTIDATVLVLLVMMLGRILQGALFSKGAAPQDIFLFLAYFIIPTGIWGQTLGKWAAGIAVVDEQGRPPGVAMAIPREVAWKVVSYLAAGIGLLWILFDKERRGWHDKLAGTWVVLIPDPEAPILSKLFRNIGRKKK